MDQGLNVVLIEKLPGGELKEIETRRWSMNMVSSLEHVNYLVVGNQEYETIEGRLNVDLERLELLLVKMKHDG
ncbi:hypothetical protein M6D81_18120 [Paenibacillus sp. J5C_2022]|uniref:hypothetical protein n=1 Tax=Paenibacillus sp. J5C2022 TaxID=2977129 RepID=UPI0021D1F280|nr:hypothetical protein [Paenibacillus sp. J5C2022]MCU6710612.1 hypothetical protein [Paenibacillus sp. J5C2022]